jgi:hypothetical protein
MTSPPSLAILEFTDDVAKYMSGRLQQFTTPDLIVRCPENWTCEMAEDCDRAVRIVAQARQNRSKRNFTFAHSFLTCTSCDSLGCAAVLRQTNTGPNWPKPKSGRDAGDPISSNLPTALPSLVCADINYRLSRCRLGLVFAAYHFGHYAGASAYQPLITLLIDGIGVTMGSAVSARKRPGRQSPIEKLAGRPKVLPGS